MPRVGGGAARGALEVAAGMLADVRRLVDEPRDAAGREWQGGYDVSSRDQQC